MAKNKKCAICGKEFVTSKAKKYCSFSCKEAGARLKKMEWHDKNPKYSTEYMRSYRQTKAKLEASKASSK